jgi:hypothetical protein
LSGTQGPGIEVISVFCAGAYESLSRLDGVQEIIVETEAFLVEGV